MSFVARNSVGGGPVRTEAGGLGATPRSAGSGTWPNQGRGRLGVAAGSLLKRGRDGRGGRRGGLQGRVHAAQLVRRVARARERRAAPAPRVGPADAGHVVETEEAHVHADGP